MPKVDRILDVGTAALKDALTVAQKLDWLSEDRDLPNLFVHRVFVPKAKGTSSTHVEDDDDSKDADEYNDSFVPIVRLLSEYLVVAEAVTCRSPFRAKS